MASCGRGSVLLIEGPAGIGKTRLLAAAGAAANRHGFTLVRGCADELAPPVPLAALLDAVADAPPVAARGHAMPNATDVRTHLEQLAVNLERQAAHAPTLITLDDLQWADTTTAAALRTLTAGLEAKRVGWVLSRRLGPAIPTTDWLFSELEQAGAARIKLAPLPRSAAADVVIDLLEATPDLDLLALADSAAGNPLLLVELMMGLREEGAISVRGGWARLLAKRTPRRVGNIVQERLGRLSPPSRNLLEVVASLGQHVGVGELAVLMGRPTDELLPLLLETITDDLLTISEEDCLTFRCELVRQSVAQAVPLAVRRALHGLPASGRSHVAQWSDGDQEEAREPFAMAEILRSLSVGQLTSTSNAPTCAPQRDAEDARSSDTWEQLELPMATSAIETAEVPTGDGPRAPDAEWSDEAWQSDEIRAARDASRPQDWLQDRGPHRRHGGQQRRPVGGWEDLTETERDVANLVASGLTNREVADRVFLSPHTVSFHLRKVYRKLGIASRVDLARLSIMQGRDAELGASVERPGRPDDGARPGRRLSHHRPRPGRLADRRRH